MKVEKLERLFSSYFKKWLCLPPRPLSSIGLYGKGILELPISSLTEEYKCAKGRLEMMLTESVDLVVAQVVPILMTGWTPSETTKLAKAALNSNSLLRLHPPTSDLTLSYGQHHSSSSTSSSTQQLTAPWEDAVEEAYKYKRLWYAELTADEQQHGWKQFLKNLLPSESLGAPQY